MNKESYTSRIEEPETKKRFTKSKRLVGAASIAAVMVTGAAYFHGGANRTPEASVPANNVQSTMTFEQADSSSVVPQESFVSDAKVETLLAVRDELRNTPTDVPYSEFTVDAGENLIDVASYSINNDKLVGLPYMTEDQHNMIQITAKQVEVEMGHVTPAGFEGVVYKGDFDGDGSIDLIVDKKPHATIE